jgi:hypothetical protein
MKDTMNVARCLLRLACAIEIKIAPDHEDNDMKNGANTPARPKTAKEVNQGEGDKKSAKRFNQEQKDFVQSARGQDTIKQAGDVLPEDEAALVKAEREGRSRAKAEDPAVTRHDTAADQSSKQDSKKAH